MTTEDACSLHHRRLIGLLQQINQRVTVGTKQTIRILAARHRHFINVLTQLDTRIVVYLRQLTITTSADFVDFNIYYCL